MKKIVLAIATILSMSGCAFFRNERDKDLTYVSFYCAKKHFNCIKQSKHNLQEVDRLIYNACMHATLCQPQKLEYE